jgi:hypothetical protein
MKLICPECRRENEPERIYCHDCGARLDRSELLKQKPQGEDPQETQRRLRWMMDKRRVALRLAFFKTAKVLLGALVAAAVVQMLRPPDLPAREEDDLALPPQINLDLENAATDPRITQLRYTEAQVNDYLDYTLKGKRTALSGVLTFERAVAAFGEGWVHVTVERSLFGFSVFTSAGFSPRVQEENITATSRGGSVGRLPVHPAIMEYGGFLFSDLWQALDRERRTLAKLRSIEFREDSVFISAH